MTASLFATLWSTLSESDGMARRGAPPCVTRELPGAYEGARRRVRDHLHDGTRGIDSG